MSEGRTGRSRGLMGVGQLGEVRGFMEEVTLEVDLGIWQCWDRCSISGYRLPAIVLQSLPHQENLPGPPTSFYSLWYMLGRQWAAKPPRLPLDRHENKKMP
jgi:hypothetical protein